MSDLGFEWSTGSTGVDAEAPAEKANRWSRRFRPEADVQTATPAQKAHQVPKIRYFLVFDLEGKYEIIEFPVLLFDAVAGCEIGPFPEVRQSERPFSEVAHSPTRQQSRFLQYWTSSTPGCKRWWGKACEKWARTAQTWSS